MVFAVTDIKKALSAPFSEIRWILCLYWIGRFSQLSSCNIFLFESFSFSFESAVCCEIIQFH